MLSKCIINDGVQRGSLLSMTTEQYSLLIKKSKQSICVVIKYSQDKQRCLIAFSFQNKQFEGWFYVEQITIVKFSCFEGGDYLINLSCECGAIYMLDKWHHKDTVSKNWCCSTCNGKIKSKPSYFHCQHTNNGADNSYFQIGDKRVYTS